MIIEKILNNNVVVSRNDMGVEVILMGKGIAFGKKIGDSITKSKIDKIFSLDNQKQKQRYYGLLENVSMELIDVSQQVLKYAEHILHQKFSDHQWITLADHIQNAMTRKKQGHMLRNDLLWDLKNFYPREYLVGLHALTVVEQKLNVTFSNDEAGFIAMHFINANLNNSVQASDVTRLLHEITNIIKYTFNVEIDEESAQYYRYLTHIKFFAQRVLQNRPLISDDDFDIYNLVSDKYISANLCAESILAFIKDKYGFEASINEKTYLIIHIHKLIYTQ